MANTKIQASTQKLVDDMRNVVTDSELLLKEVGGELTEKAKQARARLALTLESAKESCINLQERAKVTAKAADEMVHEHPYKSMGIAFGVGIVLGVLIARK
ncbi:MAG: DUF883 domain-containing protein [Verrucomicrobiota bacterium]